VRQGEYSLLRLMPHKGDSSVNRKVSSAQFGRSRPHSDLGMQTLQSPDLHGGKACRGNLIDSRGKVSRNSYPLI
jgi:hypothetical protein